MTDLRLLLVGRRQGALAAAARLGAEVLLLDDGRPGRQARRLAGFARADLADSGVCVREARKLAARRPVDAVVALVERAVLPAAAIREALGVRGACVERARAWRDKLVMKERVRGAGIACAEVRAIDRSTDPDALAGALGLPLVVKPRSASGGRGRTLAQDLGAVRAALSDGCIAERYVPGAEVSVESLVVGGRVVFENVTEYLCPGWANIVPAALPPDVEDAVRRTNRAALTALDVTDGITHLEAFVGADVVFGEVACRPPGGALMELLSRAYGFDAWQTHLEIEAGRTVRPPNVARASAGVWFLHPGEGRVAVIEGLEEARAVEGVATVECKLVLGQIVRKRESVGQHTGRIVVETTSRDATKAALETALARIRLVTEPTAGRGAAAR